MRGPDISAATLVNMRLLDLIGFFAGEEEGIYVLPSVLQTERIH